MPTACFFSHESLEQLRKEQYSIQDLEILERLGYEVKIATRFSEIPFGCDLYFSWWASGSILPAIKARLSRRPIIVVAGGNEAMRYRDSVSGVASGFLATPWYKKLATLACLRLATRVLVVSRFMIDDVVSLGAKDPIVVPNSVDTEAFVPSGEKRIHVTSIFNLYEGVVALKRGEVLLRAIPKVLARYPDQSFVIIGAIGDAHPRLARLATELGVAHRVQFVGSIPNAQVVAWLQRSRAYVQISDTETFGVAVAEAMSCGTQVVVSARGALPELVGDCGIVVNHNEPGAVAEGILKALAVPADRAEIAGSEARARIVRRYSRDARRRAIEQIVTGLRVAGA